MIRKRIFIAAALVATSLMSAPLALPASLYASQGNPGTAMLRANNSDTGYHFKMKNKGGTSGTGFRKKTNTSRIYVGVSSCYGDPRMFVDGATNTSGSGRRDCTYGTYRARTKGNFTLRSNVYEWGYRAAQITSLSEHGEALVSGVWSPDSTVNNPVMGS